MNAADMPLWTIEELSAQVALALSQDPEPSPNGRIREVPDLRTIRYYTTLGLIDRPTEMRGRTALYGRRHLLQLVAIKKLQASGRSLAEVQRTLAGQTDKALAEVAGLDEGGLGDRAGLTPVRRAARDFWRQAPAPHEPEESELVVQASRLHPGAGRRDACTTKEGGGDRDRPTPGRPAEEIQPQTFHGV